MYFINTSYNEHQPKQSCSYFSNVHAVRIPACMRTLSDQTSASLSDKLITRYTQL